MRQLVADIEAKDGGEEWVMDQLADGCTVRSIAEGLGVSRRYLYMWRDRPGHKERLKPMWEAAVRLSAEADLENSIADFDRLDRVIQVDEDTGEDVHRVPATSEVQLVTGRAKFRQWLAGRKDPERFGEDKGVNVNLNIGDLHVEAVEAVKQRHRLEAQVPLKAEVVEEEVGEDEAKDLGGLAALME
jgi:hypothetical protein